MTKASAHPQTVQPSEQGLLPKTTLLTPDAALRSLAWSAKLWFVAAVAGQWMFTGYILAVYWLNTGDHERSLSAQGDPSFLAHVGLAVLVFVAGPLQFISRIRAKYPRIHRSNGRLYVLTVLAASGYGVYMIWVHGTVGGLGVQIGTSLDALLIAVFAWKAVQCARAGNVPAHQRWAIRLFIAAVAVWFFRIGIMIWFMLTGGWGINPETFEGPALVVMSFTQYLIPLAILELYFFAQAKPNASIRIATAGVIFVSTVATVVGTYAATVGMWLPRM